MSILKLQLQNIAAAAAYTEYSFTLPPRVSNVSLYLRSVGINPANLFYYTTPSGSPAPGTAANLPALYNTVPAGNAKTVQGMLGAQTIYFQTDGSTQVLEVDYYGDN